jgi:hypothetical protein
MKLRPEDPILQTSRREALLTVGLWAMTMLYTVVYCYTHGYSRGTDGYDRKLDTSLEGMTFVFGWPDWVFWGIVLPWGVCTIVSAIFAFVFMRDAPLAAEGGDEPEDLG